MRMKLNQSIAINITLEEAKKLQAAIFPIIQPNEGDNLPQMHRMSVDILSWFHEALNNVIPQEGA